LHEILYLTFYQLLIGTKIQPGLIRAILMTKEEGLKVILLPIKKNKSIFLGLLNGFKNRVKS
jgi:hypothetical protein